MKTAMIETAKFLVYSLIGAFAYIAFTPPPECPECPECPPVPPPPFVFNEGAPPVFDKPPPPDIAVGAIGDDLEAAAKQAQLNSAWYYGSVANGVAGNLKRGNLATRTKRQEYVERWSADARMKSSKALNALMDRVDDSKPDTWERIAKGYRSVWRD